MTIKSFLGAKRISLLIGVSYKPDSVCRTKAQQDDHLSSPAVTDKVWRTTLFLISS